METVRKFSLIKPTLDTPFHIDFDWWKAHDSDWRVFLYNLLCEEHQDAYKDQDTNVIVDFVDPVTAEVTAVDGLLHTLLNHCAKQPDFITKDSSLVSMSFVFFWQTTTSRSAPTNCPSKSTARQIRFSLLCQAQLFTKAFRPVDKK